MPRAASGHLPIPGSFVTRFKRSPLPEQRVKSAAMSRLGLIFAVLYAATCASALAYILLAGEELAGVLILILGLPWTLVFTFAILAIGSSSAWLISGSFIVSCLLNCWLMYHLGIRFGRRR